MSRYMQQLSLWVFPDISELNYQFHYFPNPTNLIPELMVEPGGVTLAAHGPQCQRERPVLPHPGRINNPLQDFPGGPVVKNLLCNAGDTSSIPGLGRFHMPQSN